MNIVTDSINGLSPSVEIDTIRALSKVTIKGHVEDFYGNTLSGFNGVVYPTVFDKLKEQNTLSNDGIVESPMQVFYTQTNRLYRGKASVVNGYFEFTFIVPKDINYAFDLGKISYYAETIKGSLSIFFQACICGTVITRSSATPTSPPCPT